MDTRQQKPLSPVGPSLEKRALRRLGATLLALFLLLLFGSVGYHLIEGMNFIDALYMAVITISTVGFGEVEQLSEAGRLFTILLIVGGGGIAAYSLSTAAEFVLTGEWRVHLEKRKQQQTLSKLTDHTIVCGYGRMGKHVVQELLAQNMPFVVIEPDAEKVTQIDAMGSLALQGDASYEDNLRMAGIERARSLVSVASSDAENVFIVLTARSMRSDLVIISRANSDESEEKLLRAGANRVILPYRITGRRLVALLIRPDVADFLDEVMHASQLELIVDQVQISPESPLAGQTIRQAELRNRFGITVLACRLPNDHINTSPSAETEIQAGSYLIVLGTPEQLQQLQEVACNSL